MYTYKDRKLTKEQVDKLAAEKGVEVDVFLTNNPDIEIQEAVVETTEPEGKTPTTETDTTVDVTKVSDTGLPLEPGSSGFTEEGEIILSGEEVEKGSFALEPVALEEVVVTAEEYKQKEKDLQAVAVKEMFENGDLGRIQFLRAAHQQEMAGWPGYWEGLPPMHYATHCVGPCLGLPDKLAEFVSCLGSGRIDEALEMMQRAVTLVSDDPVIYEHLGEIWLLQEEREKAREAWIHSLQLDSTNETLRQRFRDTGFGEPLPTLSQQSTYTP